MTEEGFYSFDADGYFPTVPHETAHADPSSKARDFHYKLVGLGYREKVKDRFKELRKIKGQSKLPQEGILGYQRVRGAIARTAFSEIVFEEAIPIDQEFLPREQHDFRDLVKSLKGRKGKDGERIPTKITFLANAYSWSA
ncbi:14686_t:CDS:2 [Ambispora leptoticha]|uniref:14686_t:CDS:1 n=1 Tax=Ambispora leptoticha TaxID=144679 RepID=A0A9N9E2M8_9GLOM|nr:14686_t:CDS:2 [Ambispora leptoticha]